jgi:hypothetical protein
MAIQKQSIDPDVALAASQALEIIDDVLNKLPPADTFDYGGHMMKIGDYNVCEVCTRPIAEAQQAHFALMHRIEKMDDPEIREHIELAAQLLKHEADAAIIRAELHNGLGSEKIVDRLNGFKYDRHIQDNYEHSHEHSEKGGL